MTKHPGPGEVVLEMRAAALNYRDLLIQRGTYRKSMDQVVPFSDGCGVVVDVGPGVERVQVGDRVVPNFFERWLAGEPTKAMLNSTRGGPLPGCGQEFLRLSAEGVSRVPDFLSDVQAATLPCAALTAWRALVVEGRIRAGDLVLLEGTGGVSIFGLQLAKACGAEVIITSSSDEKLERARALGADHVINYGEHPDWSEEVLRLTGGRGVDHVLEVGGAGTLKQAMKSVRFGGNIFVIGVLSGAGHELNIGAVIGAGVRMKGIFVGNREDFESMCRAIELHRIEPVIDREFPLAEADAALAYLEAGRHFGKIVLTI